MESRWRGLEFLILHGRAAGAPAMKDR